MLSRTRSVVGLDIGTSTVKAIELTQKGRDVEVTAFGQIEVHTDSPDDRARAVKDLLKEGGFNARRMVTGISGKSVIVRYLNMVQMSDEELKNAITFEAEKYIPFPLDECVLDCQRLDGDATSTGGNMTVLLVAARRSHVEDHLGIAEAGGVAPEVVDVDAFALSNAYGIARESMDELEGDEDGGTIAFVDVGASKTNVNVVSGGVSLFTREISLGGREFTEAISKRLGVGFDEAEDLKRVPGDGGETVREAVFPAIDDLGNEVQLSFEYFESQFNREIGTIYLSGGGARLEFFKDAFERIFEKPTFLFNPFEHIGVDGAIDADLLACNASQLVTAVGLAARLTKA